MNLTATQKEQFTRYERQIDDLTDRVMKFVENVDPDADDKELSSVYSTIQTLAAQMNRITRRATN